MNFSRPNRHLLRLLLALALLLDSGCRRSISPTEQRARSEVQQALQKRAFAQAVAPARQVLQFASHDNGAWARLAQAQFGLRDLAALRQTLEQWQRAVRTTSAKYDEYRGDLARIEGRKSDALAAWTHAVAGKDRRTRVFRKIARLEQAERHWPEAAAAWTRAMKNRPTASTLRQRAICYRHLHSWDAALADLQKAAQLAPQDGPVKNDLARLDRLGKFLAEVRDLDRDLTSSPNDMALLADRALLFLRADDAALALDDATRAAQLAPQAVRPKLFRAMAERRLGRKATAAAALTRLRLESLSSDFLQTIRRLDDQLAVEPKSVDLLTNRAWQLNEIGQPALALADAEAARQADPKSAGAAAEASYALAKLKRPADAYRQIKEATELDPNFSTAWQYRGELEMNGGDYLAAAESLSRALAINQTAGALAKREECYRKLGLLAKAEDDHRTREQLSAPQ